MSLTDDPNDPRLKRGPPDDAPTEQNAAYLVLSEEERAKGFVRPVRTSYRHVGPPATCGKPTTLSNGVEGYCVDEPGHEGDCTVWQTAEARDKAMGCGQITTMARPLGETYARDPNFYGATFCTTCKMHRPVGARGEFVWIETDGSTGPRVGT